MKPMNSLHLPEALPAVLSGLERTALEAELYALLEERAERYTMGDSTSLRTETAEALLRGILFCITLSCGALPEAGGQRTVKELFDQGVMEAERQAKRGRLLLRQAESFPPPVTNLAYRDTLAALPGFFKRYDPAYLSTDIPCDIDYPLCHPLDEALPGIRYINGYLRRILAENAFLRRFAKERLIALYERCLDDYDGLLVNLYAPAAEAAIGCALAGTPVRELTIPKEQRAAACDRLAALPIEEAEQALSAAAKEVCRAMDITGEAERDYLTRAAWELLPRIRACAAAGSTERVIPSA